MNTEKTLLESGAHRPKSQPKKRPLPTLSESWEIYLLLGLSVFGIVGHYIGVTDPKSAEKIIPLFQHSLTFLILFLCLLGIHLLRHEHKNKELQDAANWQLAQLSQSVDNLAQRMASPAHGEFLESLPDDYSDRFSQAEDVLQIGIHLSSNLNDFHGDYTKLLASGGKLRILVVKPNGDAIKMASLRFPAAQTPDMSQETARARASLARFCNLKQQYPSQVSIRVLDYLFTHSVTCVDVDKPNGIFYVERYTFRTQGGNRKPKYVFGGADRKMFELFKNESDALWKAAEDYLP